MQLLAHQGPNWKRHALTVHPCSGVSAIASGHTILLYNADNGSFSSEIRHTGRGMVVSLDICSADGLSNLLLSLTCEDHLKIFDVQTRRIMYTLRVREYQQRLNSAVYACFLRSNPNYVIMVNEHGSGVRGGGGRGGGNGNKRKLSDCNRSVEIVIVKIQNSHIVKRFHLPDMLEFISLHDITTHDESAQGSSLYCVGSNIVYHISLQHVYESNNSNNHSSLQYNVQLQPVYDISNTGHQRIQSVSMRSSQNTGNNLHIAIIHDADYKPTIFDITNLEQQWGNNCSTDSPSSNDVQPWASSASAAHNSVNHTTNNNNTFDNSPNYNQCCEWYNENMIITSNASGTLFVWIVMDISPSSSSSSIQLLAVKEKAHLRQVFSIKPYRHSFLTISLDRTFAKWKLSKLSKMVLCWRTLRSNGGITAVNVNGSKFSFANGSGSIIQGDIKKIGYSSSIIVDNISEAIVIGSVLGKKLKRNAIVSNIYAHNNFIVYAFYSSAVGTLHGEKNEHKVCKWPRNMGQQPLLDENGSNKGGNKRYWIYNDLLVLYDRSNKDKLNLTLWQMNKDRNLKVQLKNDYYKHKKVCHEDHAVLKKILSSKITFISLQSTTHDLYVGDSDGRVFVIRFKSKCSCDWMQLNVQSTIRRLRKITHVAITEDSSFIAVHDQSGLLVVSTVNFGVGGDDASSSSLNMMAEIDLSTSASSSSKSNNKCISKLIWGYIERNHSYMIAIFNDDQIYIWECSTNEQSNELRFQFRAEIKEHIGTVNDISYDSGYLLSGGQDGTLRLWDIDKLPMPTTNPTKI